MITLQELTLAGFRSFRLPAVFKFPDTPGLYFLGGRNLVEPHLSPNACGKSSLFDGLRWVLYGATARGGKANDVANWAGGKTAARLRFKKGGTAYTLTRRWRPNALTLETPGNPKRIVTQSELDDLLGMNADTFMGAYFFGQFNQFFFDLSPAEKLSVFTDSLGLAAWEGYARKAAGESVAADNAAQTALTLAARWRGNVEALKTELETERELEVAHTTKFLADRANLFRQRGQAKTELEKWKKLVSTAQKNLDFHAAVEKTKQQKINGYAEALQYANKLLSRAEYTWEKAKENLQKAENELAEIDRPLPLCPVCRRPLAVDTVKRERKGIVAAIAALKAKAITEETAYNQQKAAVEKIEKGKREYLESIKDISGMQAAFTDVRISQNNYARAAATVEQLNAQINAPNEKNPHTARIAEIKQRGKAALAQMRQADNAALAAQAKAQAYGFWAKEFRNVRLWLIDEALEQLTIEINNYLPELGLNGWAISFAVERQTAGGGVSRGFNVFIQSPQSGKPVRWENWCGGETQRLRIAGAKGLANLLRARASDTFNIEIWDEPTAHINAAGVETLPAFFAERAKEEGRVIWWVDHRTVNSGEFSGGATVVKDKYGSRIEY